MVWIAAVAVGLRELARYETSSGERVAGPSQWPAASALPRGPGFSLVMFLHPDCPCSRASLDELEVVAATGRVTIVVAFSAEEGDMWDRAGRIRGVARVVDDGSEAKRFGARTSGHVVVFDARGALRFAGGITGSRGHAGNNVGRKAVELVLAGDPGPAEHAVFGCALNGASS